MRGWPHVARTARASFSIFYLADSVLFGDHRRHRCPAWSAGPSGISPGLVYRSSPASGAFNPDCNFLVLRTYAVAVAVDRYPGIHQGFRRSADGIGKPVRVRRLEKIVGHAAIGKGIVRRLWRNEIGVGNR